MKRRTHIVIAEPSVIIRSGLIAVLKRLTSLSIDVAEIIDIHTLVAQLCKFKPDVLIIDPSQLGVFSLQRLRKEVGHPEIKIIALQNTMVDSMTLKHYDEVVSIYDSLDTIKDKLERIIVTEETTNPKQELSVREKEIVVCIVKGMTNKQIADHLILSTHTIMSHRRNIVSKLQIHSPAGLTIYAIVNKLVEIDQIKNSINADE